MRTKDGVDLSRLRPEMVRLFPIAEQVYHAFGKEAVVTSTYEGKHSDDSLHYLYLAFDLRVHHLGEFPARKSVFKCYKAEVDRLYPGQYDIIHHRLFTPQEHIHTEASPLLLVMIEGSTKEVEAT